MILLDTSVLIEYHRLEPLDDQVCFSAISYGELAMGVRVAKTQTERQRRQSILAGLDAIGLEWLPFDRLAAQGYAELAAVVWQRRRAHARAKDIMLAGQAYSLGASLATLNSKDFELVEDLVVVVEPAFA